MASEHLTKDDQTCVHGVHVREACAYCQQEGKGRPTSNERTQQLRYPDAWGDTALLKRNAKWAADELDRQRAEVERLTAKLREEQELVEINLSRMRDRALAYMRERDRLRAALEKIADFDCRLDEHVGDMKCWSCYAREALSSEPSADETAGDWLTNEQCDDVIAFLEDYEWTGLTRENVRTWCTAIAEARSSVKANECKPGFTQACSSFGDDPDAPGCCSYCGQPREAHPQKGPP